MNEHIPKISVFIACKNGQEYLRETLDSIFNQTFQDFEIVLVDSESTDDTIDILKSYKDPRLRWISEQDNDANEGYYKAFERLLPLHCKQIQGHLRCAHCLIIVAFDERDQR